MTQFDQDETQLAWFYHLGCTQEMPDSWYFHEACSVVQPIPFKLYRWPLPCEADDLISTQGFMLPALYDTLPGAT
ncbi:MAG: hypothetical protein ACI8Z1_000059 [Candidatus Azotimanducaceae bacterium]|jgi:hypothetical protein